MTSEQIDSLLMFSVRSLLVLVIDTHTSPNPKSNTQNRKICHYPV